jgi:glucoamylase
VAKYDYAGMNTAVGRSDPGAFSTYFLPLMLRNMSSAGYVFTDPADPASFSAPGCIIASPSYEGNLTAVRQDYVFNWTRDAAVTAMEIAAAGLPVRPDSGSGPLDDYVTFADTCQQRTPTLARAAYTVEGNPRQGWTDQNDGPALQTMAVLQAFDQLDPGTQQTARTVMQRNLDFVVQHYQEPSFNLWEEVKGQSFFTRAVQLQCLLDVKANTIGLSAPAGADDAIAWLRQALTEHWDGTRYVSVLAPENPRGGYDPNIDIVLAALYGAVDVTDPRLLATAARIRWQWADPASPDAYPVNGADAARSMGPLFGRYPGDVYDGDTDARVGDHPWALCTAAFAQLCYAVGAAVKASGEVPQDALAAPFFEQVGVSGATAPADAVESLVNAGDSMLRAIVFHSDHLELSEQFDGITGYEKSVRNLTWSYAAYLSAVRSRAAAVAS